MRRLGALVIVGLFAVAQGCSSTTQQNPTAAGGSHGGASTTAQGGSSGGASTTAKGGSSGGSSMVAQGGSSGGTTASTCQLPSCLKNLGADCAPSGTCTVEDHPDTGAKNFCYGNGVKKITVLDVSDYSTALTVTKSGSTCFTTAFIGNDFFNSQGDLTVKDASGATVATLAMDADTSTHFIVTCPGADPVTLDDSCKTVWPVSGLTDQGGATCTDGTCSP